jgi:hypothetical protein
MSSAVRIAELEALVAQQRLRLPKLLAQCRPRRRHVPQDG